MQTSNQLLKPTIALVLGFVLGLGAANYFSGADKEDVVATTPSATETVKTSQAYMLPATLNAPIRLAAGLGPHKKDGMDINTLSADISLPETVDINREQSATTEPSPEELAKSQPMDRAATPRFSPQETDGLESKLRLESENAASIPLETTEGLLEHEKL